VYAAGDVARWWNPRFGEAMRVEHWTTASEMGRFAGRAAAGDPGSHTFRPVPYAWSDQHGIRFETAGRPRADDDLQVVRASPATREFLALYSRRGRVVGAVGINARRTFLTCRRLIQQGAHIDDALARCSVDDRGTSGLTATAVRNT
jgi:NADPH-dependent 2,4-dienoyl-CoA reductase/sulfur reductase-like enzyme